MQAMGFEAYQRARDAGFTRHLVGRAPTHAQRGDTIVRPDRVEVDWLGAAAMQPSRGRSSTHHLGARS